MACDPEWVPYDWDVVLIQVIDPGSVIPAGMANMDPPADQRLMSSNEESRELNDTIFHLGTLRTKSRVTNCVSRQNPGSLIVFQDKTPGH